MATEPKVTHRIASIEGEPTISLFDVIGHSYKNIVVLGFNDLYYQLATLIVVYWFIYHEMCVGIFVNILNFKFLGFKATYKKLG